MSVADRFQLLRSNGTIEVVERHAMLVATKTTTVKGEDGKPEQLKAGVTRVRVRHFLTETYPHLFAAEPGPARGKRHTSARPRPPRRARATAPAARHVPECPRVVLLDNAEPTVTVRLWPRASEAVRHEGFCARDGHETGGALYGRAHADNPTELTVERAGDAGPRSRRSAAEFRVDIDYYVRKENGPVRWIGDWHCHPVSQHGLPSPADLKGWARALQMYGPERGLTHYVGLILTAPEIQDAYGFRQDWNRIRPHAWVLSNAFERWVCTPGRIDGW